MKARINGINAQMQKFRFLFALLLSQMIFQHTDRLSSTLQHSDLSSVEGYEVAMLTVQTLERMRIERDFDLFWAKIETKRNEFEVEEPIFPRRRKNPKRLEDGIATAEFPDSVIDWYRSQYNVVLDLAVSSIKARFDQKGYQQFSHIEQLLLNGITC